MIVIDRGTCFMLWWSEGADAVSEFVWQGWFWVVFEECLVGDFAELGEPVA